MSRTLGGTSTRAQFVRRASGVGLGLALGGGAAWRLLDSGTSPTKATVVAAPVHDEPGVHTFYSRPDLRPPTVTVVHRNELAAERLFFLTPLTGPGQRGALIVDAHGHPVWFRSAGASDATNLGVSEYRGAPVLTWWEGKLVDGGVGQGQYYVADERYRTVARFSAGLDYHGDLHEFVLTPQGTALVTVQRVVRADLRSLGGARDAEVIDTGFQEIDVATGEVLMHWSGIGHIAFSESYKPLPKDKPFDYLHLNSVSYGPDGTILLSARHTWTLYSVDRRTGAIVWRLGGKRSTFAVPQAARFSWQHDARWLDAHTLTLFDDGAAPDADVESQSRGLELAVDRASRRVALRRSYTHSPPQLATAMGSVQTLPAGEVLVGWGTRPYLTLYGGDGHVLLDARLPKRGSSYRAFTFPWTGRPEARPHLVARSAAASTRLYASWNGATELAAWHVTAGRTPDRLVHAAHHPATGFETSFAAPHGARYAAVTALDAAGAPLAASAAVRL